MEADIIKKLSSLGCAFAKQNFAEMVDPEKTIVEALTYFWIDKKIFTLLIALLKYRIPHLINTSRLYSEIQKQDDDIKILLKVIALKVARQTKDTRYIDLAKKIKVKTKLQNIPDNYSDEFFIKKNGIDKDFKKVGVKVADFFDFQTEKKLKPLKKIYMENEWLKLRAISGADYRADVIYLKKTNKNFTQTEIAGLLGCNKSSISRIWSSIKDIDTIVDLV